MSRKIVLITGGSSGIGESLAIAIGAKENYQVVIASRKATKLSKVKDKAARNGVYVDSIVIDVKDEQEVKRQVFSIVEKYGKIDVLINCAGIGGGGVTKDYSDGLWHDIINTNLNGAYHVTKAILNLSGMLERRWGRIINIASTGGKQGVMYAAAYSASKHGMIGLTKALGLELAKSGVTVNAICPGFVETPLAEQARYNYSKVWKCSEDEAKRRIETRVPIGRYINPDEIAPLALYLMSEEASGVVAQAMNICGGLGNY